MAERKIQVLNVSGFRPRRTIQSDLFLVVISINLITALSINVIYFSRMQKVIRAEVETLSYGAFLQAVSRLDDMREQIVTAQRFIVGLIDEESTLFTSGSLPGPEKIQKLNEERRLLTSVKTAFPFLDEIYLIGSDNWLVTNNSSVSLDSFFNQPWIGDIGTALPVSLIVEPRPVDYYDRNRGANTPRMVSFILSAALFSDSSKRFLLQLDVAEEVFLRPLLDARENGNLEMDLEDKDGLLLLSSRTGERIHYADTSFLTFSETLPRSGWTFRGWLNIDGFKERLIDIRRLAFFLGAAAIFASLGLAYIASRRLSKPLLDMIEVMDEVGGGDFSREIPDSDNADLHHFNQAFGKMLRRIQTLMIEIRKKEKERALAEYRALEAQVNPHFLYNTLNTIQSMAGGNEAVAEMTRSLARLFRYSIEDKGERVPLDEELKHIQNYLTLQNYRFTGRIHARIQVEEDIKNVPVPRLFLQPLVENCYKHGLEMMESGGIIVITARREGRNLIVEVTDNGQGMSPERMQELQGSILRETGIGLSNLQSRLRKIFGEREVLFFSSRPGGGARVTVKIPLD